MNLERLKQQWLPLCLASKITSKPQAFVLLDMPLVVYRVNNQIIALLDKCPHRGAPLSAGRLNKDLLQCPYHGWSFNTKGECVTIPGLISACSLQDKRVRAYATVFHMGLIFVCLDKNESTMPLYDIPALSLPKMQAHFMQFEIQGEILNIIENTLDATHTHFVHAKLLRQDGKRQRVRATLTVKANAAEVCYEGEARQSGLLNALFERQRKSSIGRFQFPLIGELEYHSATELTAAFSFFLSPSQSNNHRVFVFISHQHHWLTSWLKKIMVLPFIKMALKQDLAILQKQEKNLALFPETAFKSTELDILRPHIERIMNNEAQAYEKIIHLKL